ncbi:MAG: hypothetical protein H6579_03365 [Chitinophagales bacterium]|nr:hypothetical protein [Chitinophagales bacterium]
MSKITHYLLSLLLLLLACRSKTDPTKHSIAENNLETILPNEYDTVENLIQESLNYLQNRDFDGDNFEDYLIFSYSGGAHCCYSLQLVLSSLGDTLSYPFEMDGGYGFGIVDGSNHDQFDIDDYDQDGLDEIFMGISTYNGELMPIEEAWTKEYGISSNYILFDFFEGEIRLLDYNPKLHLNKTKNR